MPARSTAGVAGGLIAKIGWKRAALAACLLALAWFLVTGPLGKAVNWPRVFDTLARLDRGWLALSCLAVLASYFVRALRWGVLNRSLRPRPGYRNLLSATIIGFTAVTLLGRPGEFVRPYLIASKEKLPFSSQLAALLLERLYDLLAVLALFGFGLTRLHASNSTAGPMLSWILSAGGWVAAALSVACMAGLLLTGRLQERTIERLLLPRNRAPGRLREKIGRLSCTFVRGLESTRDVGSVLRMLWYSALEWGVIVFCMYCILRAFGSMLQFSLIDVLIFTGFVSFGAAVQVPGVGGGIQVTAVLVLTELFHVPVPIAATVALVIWFVTFVVVIPAGLALGFRDGLEWRNLRKLSKKEGAVA